MFSKKWFQMKQFQKNGVGSWMVIAGCSSCHFLLRNFAVAVLALSCGAARAQVAFPLHTEGAQIVDANGHRVRLNAVNWYGAETKDFVVGGLDAAPLGSIVQQIKRLGFNTVRLPWSNELFETPPSVDGYADGTVFEFSNLKMTGEDAFTILDQVITALTNAGIMVVLDNHSSNAEWCCDNNDGNALWHNDGYPTKNWVSDWKRMAQFYRSNPWVIGVDLRNEPRDNATWRGDPCTPNWEFLY